MAFFSSLIAGLLWNNIGIPAPFYFGGILSATAGVIFIAGSANNITGDHMNHRASPGMDSNRAVNGCCVFLGMVGGH